MPVQRDYWYLDPTQIREKKNRQWTPDERWMILNMREIGMSVAEIIKVFNGVREDLSPTKIHNQTRMARAAAQKRCYMCRRKLTKKDLKQRKRGEDLCLCHHCRTLTNEYKRVRRQRALKKGKCAVCMRRKVLPGKTMCKRCISYTHRRRILKGLCSSCGRYSIAPGSKSLCKSCLEKNRKRSRYYRHQRR